MHDLEQPLKYLIQTRIHDVVHGGDSRAAAIPNAQRQGGVRAAGQEAVFLFLCPALLRHKPGLQAGHVLKNVADATLERAYNDQGLDQTHRLTLVETPWHAQAHGN